MRAPSQRLAWKLAMPRVYSAPRPRRSKSPPMMSRQMCAYSFSWWITPAAADQRGCAAMRAFHSASRSRRPLSSSISSSPAPHRGEKETRARARSASRASAGRCSARRRQTPASEASPTITRFSASEWSWG